MATPAIGPGASRMLFLLSKASTKGNRRVSHVSLAVTRELEIPGFFVTYSPSHRVQGSYTNQVP